jgi:uncharacterized membrane protein YphA (DoxX/SURF4 family)
MRLPGSVVQGILARAALAFLRVYLGVVIAIRAGNEMLGGGASQLPVPVTWGELVVGAALVIGCFTRFAAAVVLVLSVNNMIVAGREAWNPGSGDAVYAAVALALLIGAAGRTAGLDALLARRWPRSPLW